MSDPEPPSGPDDDSGSGLSSLLKSTPKVIGSITALIGAISGLLLALNKGGVIGGDGGEAAAKTTTTPAQSLLSPMKRPVGHVSRGRHRPVSGREPDVADPRAAAQCCDRGRGK